MKTDRFLCFSTGTKPETTTNSLPGPPRANVEGKSFGRAYEEGYKLTQRFLMSRGVPPDAAEEVAQAAWAKGWECRAQLQNPTLLGAWVNSIAKNLLRNRLRTDRRLQKLEPPNWIACCGADGLLFIRQVLKTCSPTEGALLSAYYLEGYTTEEIARRSGLSAVTVRVKLLRLRRALRLRLGAEPQPSIAAA